MLPPPTSPKTHPFLLKIEGLILKTAVISVFMQVSSRLVEIFFCIGHKSS